MSEWSEATLEELCSLIVDSEHKTAPKSPDGQHPLIRTPDLGSARINLATEQRVDRPTYLAWTKRAVPREGDLILAREAPVGGVGRVPRGAEPVLGQRTVLLRPDAAVVDSNFLTYRLAAPDAQSRMNELATGATVPHLNMSDIRSFSVDLPTSRAMQRRVAALLASFDELIEINERRIEVLEELARSLYREWFVRFRFPGHEETKFIDSELGPIPRGWKVRPCAEVFDFVGGGTPSKKEAAFWNDGVIPWYTPSDLTRSKTRHCQPSELRITEAGLARSSARLFPAGSVLMTSRATLGVLSIAVEDSTCNQGFIVFLPKDPFPPSYIFEWLADHADDLDAIATGATFKEITKGALKRFPTMVPPADILLKFAAKVEPLSHSIGVLEAQNRSLASTRDLLLPRLVTGKLDISEIDLGVLTPSEAA